MTVDTYSSPLASIPSSKGKSISVALSTKGKDELIIFEESTSRYVTVYKSELYSLISLLEKFNEYFNLIETLPTIDINILNQNRKFNP